MRNIVSTTGLFMSSRGNLTSNLHGLSYIIVYWVVEFQVWGFKLKGFKGSLYFLDTTLDLAFITFVRLFKFFWDPWCLSKKPSGIQKSYIWARFHWNHIQPRFFILVHSDMRCYFSWVYDILIYKVQKSPLSIKSN